MKQAQMSKQYSTTVLVDAAKQCEVAVFTWVIYHD